MKNVVPGDVVRVAVENAKGRNKVVVDYDELLKAGPTRNLKIPTHKAVSGGTPLQYMYYDNQLVYKMDTFRDDVKKGLSKGATVSKPSTGGKKLYRVQIGAYSAKKNADKQLEKAKKAGFKDTFVKYE